MPLVILGTINFRRALPEFRVQHSASKMACIAKNNMDLNKPRYRLLKIVVSFLVLLWALAVLAIFVGPRLAELREGPDTKQAVAGFIARFGYPPPPSISEVFFTENAWLDYDCRLRFTCSDQGQIGRMIHDLGLQPSPETRSRVATSSGPSWWRQIPHGQQNNLTYYHDLSTNSLIESFISTQKVGEVRFLWLDRSTHHVYYYETRLN
jgi:hypothetical protein